MPSDAFLPTARDRGAPRGGLGASKACFLRVAEAVAEVVLPSGRPMDSLDVTGNVWRRVWSLPDRLVVDFAGVVAVEVREYDNSVVFDRPIHGPLQRHLLFDHLLPLVLARRGVVVLHAGVISDHGRALALMGPSGAGKSTLVAYCAQHGWAPGGDDATVLRPGPPWTAEPTYAGIRLTADSHELLKLRAGQEPEVAGKRSLSADTSGPYLQLPLPLHAVVVVDPVSAPSAELTLLHGVDAHAALFRATFHTDLGDARSLESVMDRLANVVESIPVGRLTVPRGRRGLASAEQLLRRLVRA